MTAKEKDVSQLVKFKLWFENFGGPMFSSERADIHVKTDRPRYMSAQICGQGPSGMCSQSSCRALYRRVL
jgi:hypothetical protein